MKSLGNILNDIENMLKNEFIIFTSTDSLSEFSEYVEYYSPEGDWERFIEIARKLNVRMIYIFYLTGNDLDIRRYRNDVGLIEIGFYYNDIMHIFKMTTDWYDNYETLTNNDDEDEDEY
ncbi:MAG: hypothetical protein ACP5JE_02875 [Thermoplasmata archaeon]